MSTIFPLREKVSLGSREPRLVDLDDDVADEVFEALSSGTTRKIFSELHTSPQTASDLADVTDTSVQNVQYHLEKLVDVELVEVVDTWYSERGTEMKVYAPTDEALVLFAGGNKQSALRSLLKRIAGAIALLLPPSAAAAWLARMSAPPVESLGDGSSGAEPAAEPGAEPATTPNGSESTPTPETDGGVQIMDNGTPEPQTTPSASADTPVPRETSTPTPENGSRVADNASTVADNTSAVTDNASTAADAAAGMDPAVLAGTAFFLGGLFVVLVASVYLYSRSQSANSGRN